MDSLKMPDMITALVLIGALALLLYLLSRRKKFNRHSHNQKKAKQVLAKLKSFNGEYRDGQVFSYLRKIDPFVFEELLLNAFEAKGFKALRNKRYTGDGVIDGRLIDRENNLILIQAKRYTNHINKSHIQEFTALVAADPKAQQGFFVHTGKTGKSIYDLLPPSGHIRIISGKKLIDLIVN